MTRNIEQLLREDGDRFRSEPIDVPDFRSFSTAARHSQSRWLVPVLSAALVAVAVSVTVLTPRLMQDRSGLPAAVATSTTDAPKPSEPTGSPDASRSPKSTDTQAPSAAIPPPPSPLVGPNPRGGIDGYIAKMMNATNDWGLACDDAQYYFVAGSTLDTGIGELYSSAYYIKTGNSSGPVFTKAPDGTGPLKITNATCTTIDLATTDGTTKLTYDVQAGKFS